MFPERPSCMFVIQAVTPQKQLSLIGASHYSAISKYGQSNLLKDCFVILVGL